MNRVSGAMKGRKALIAGVGLGVAALTLATGMSTAGARTMSKAAPAVSHGLISNALPAGFNVATSASITAHNGTQTHGVAVCPGITKPVGGGVYVASTSTLANVNSSNPSGKHGWAADVNNTSGADTTMQVYAVCANRGATAFSVNSQSFIGAAGAQTSGSVSCPAGVVVGGGVFSASGNTSVNINSDFPNSTTSWRADMNNGNNLSEGFTV